MIGFEIIARLNIIVYSGISIFALVNEANKQFY